MASVDDRLFGTWGQLIFTHDSKLPVLISKDLVRLGRKEGKKLLRKATQTSLKNYDLSGTEKKTQCQPPRTWSCIYIADLSVNKQFKCDYSCYTFKLTSSQKKWRVGGSNLISSLHCWVVLSDEFKSLCSKLSITLSSCGHELELTGTLLHCRNQVWESLLADVSSIPHCTWEKLKGRPILWVQVQKK